MHNWYRYIFVMSVLILLIILQYDMLKFNYLLQLYWIYFNVNYSGVIFNQVFLYSYSPDTAIE